MYVKLYLNKTAIKILNDPLAQIPDSARMQSFR